MLIYLSTSGEARDVLDQRPLAEFTSDDGLKLLWRLLEEAFGESTAEFFERAEKELNAYRRLPGQSISTYVAAMKRLKAQNIATDPDTVFSDRSWAQRLLNRASLGRRERLDVFAHIHQDERKVPSGPPDPRSPRAMADLPHPDLHRRPPLLPRLPKKFKDATSWSSPGGRRRRSRPGR